MLKGKITVVGALIALAVLFQNCSQVSFTSVDSALHLSESASETEGNGTGYGGKLTGEFYRFTPDFTCEGKEAPVSSITATDTSITYTENKTLFCGSTKQDLDSKLIDRSVYQNDIIGYQEGIFESESSMPASIPANLVEVWCRDTNDRSGIETITHYDRSTQVAVTRILSAGPGTSVQTISDFNVSRVISPMLVTVTDGKDFTLKVYRDRPAAQLGLFQGSMTAVVNGQKVTRETSCRLGGGLDAKVWPARQIVDLNILLFKFTPDFQGFGLTSTTGDTIENLYRGDLQGHQIVKDNMTHSANMSLGFDFLPNMLNVYSMPLRTGPTPPAPFVWTVPAVACPQVSAAQAKFLDLGSDQWLVATWDEQTSILHIYLQNSGQCQLKNSIPLSSPVIEGLYMAPDAQKAAVSVTVNIQGLSHGQLFFVPLDGKPALQINSPVSIGTSIGNVHILPDSQTVFYTGNQLKQDEIGAFTWRAP